MARSIAAARYGGNPVIAASGHAAYDRAAVQTAGSFHNRPQGDEK
jgi:hypothetical protein